MIDNIFLEDPYKYENKNIINFIMKTITSLLFNTQYKE